jgi:hypothetical protein
MRNHVKGINSSAHTQRKLIHAADSHLISLQLFSYPNARGAALKTTQGAKVGSEGRESDWTQFRITISCAV